MASNNKISSKNKPSFMIVIIIIVIILLLVGGYYLYNFLTKDTVSGIKTVDFIKYIHDAKDYKKISGASIPASAQGNEYNINFWMYVNDYTYRYGEMKNVLNKGEIENEEMSNPGIYLLPTTNTLRVQVGLETNSLNQCNDATANVNSNPDDFIDVCDVENLPLQRWVCVNMSLTNNVIDIFLNGKLHKSCTLRGYPAVNRGHMHICNDGGFNGFISNVKFSNKALPVSQIEKIYNSGPLLKKGLFN
jgi:hypothetical protein